MVRIMSEILIKEYSPLISSARDCFQYVLYEIYNIIRYDLRS